MADHVTKRKSFPYPDAAGPIGSASPTYAPQDFEELAKAFDELNEGFVDFMLPGPVTRGGLAFGKFQVNPATGALNTETEPSATAASWCPDPVLGSAAVMRQLGAPKLGSAAPPRLPASGKFAAITLELKATTWGKAPTLSLATGPDQTTQAEAEEHLPAVSVGKMRYSWCILKNNAGTYEIVAEGLSAVAAGPSGPTSISAATGISKSSNPAENFPVSNIYEPPMPQLDVPLGSGAVCRRPVWVDVRANDVRGFASKVYVGSQQVGLLQCPIKKTKSCSFIVPPGRRWSIDSGYTGVNGFPTVGTLLDSFERVEEPELTGGLWAKLPWCADKGKINTNFGWVPKTTGTEVSGAYWNKGFLNGAVYCKTFPEHRTTFIALWLAAQPIKGTKTGYQLEYTWSGGGDQYQWTLAKWNEGVIEESKTGFVTMTTNNFDNWLGLAYSNYQTGPAKIKAYYKPPGGSWSTKLTLEDSFFSNVFPGIEGVDKFTFGERRFTAGEVGQPSYSWNYQVL